MAKTGRTQVGIIGCGPAGLMLAELLALNGIESVILERHERAYVENRIRAGVLEQGTVESLRRIGAAARLDREGLIHEGFDIAFNGKRTRIDLAGLTGGKGVVVYGQTEITKDLIALRLSRGRQIIFQAENVQLEGFRGDKPALTYRIKGEEHRLDCDFIAGCDGFHGVSRASLSSSDIQIFEQVYPYAWLGILAQAAPISEELIYAHHENGFALFSMRSASISRNYLQVAPNETLDDWSTERIWQELWHRLGTPADRHFHEGQVLEKGITPMRSFVAEPLRHGRLFLAGDAAHIVPPTGAKGLNLAVSDVHYLSTALSACYLEDTHALLNTYSQTALSRVWKVERFSWWMTRLLHKITRQDTFEGKLQQAELDYLFQSKAAQTALAENYVGLPY